MLIFTKGAAFIAAAATLATQSVLASFTNPYTPPYRGSPCSDYAQWESFTVPYGGTNSPDVAGSTNTTATLEQLLPGAILTSTGNIYNPFALTAFTVLDAAPEDIKTVSFQVSSSGNPRNYGSFILQYTSTQGLQTLAPTNFVFLVQTPGHEELLLEWDLSTNPDDITSYAINFIASAPSMSLDALILDKVWGNCSAGTAYCFGDGLDPLVLTPCPCSNFGAAGHGCANSQSGSTGSLLTAAGATTPDTIVLSASGELPNALSVFLQGNATIANGQFFGDGIRCAGGMIKRLKSKNATAGSVSYPVGTEPSITTQSAALGDPIAPGSTRYYQVYYRDPVLSFCASPPGNSWNVSNGLKIIW